MIIIGSSNGRVGIAAGWAILQAGGSALDAVEAATRLVEDNPDDHSVGYGGYPNLLGEVELDASIMDGTTLRAGAVGALKGYRAAISVARRVMEDLPHVVLVGDGAARFAAEIGMPRENLLTDHSERVWRAGLEGRTLIDWQGAPELLAALLKRSAALTQDPEHVTGTVNFIAQDRQGRIASAVSTSGWAWKYPGRLGDSPIIGGLQLRRRPLWRGGMHRLGRGGDPRGDRAQCRDLSQGWLPARSGMPRSVSRSCPDPARHAQHDEPGSH
jgi:beta-aspartyl-peptidase (threonine type)